MGSRVKPGSLAVPTCPQQPGSVWGVSVTHLWSVTWPPHAPLLSDHLSCRAWKLLSCYRRRGISLSWV